MTTDIIAERAKRLGGLRRFALAITIFNILGHTVLGFEQSLAQPFAALATAYGLEILLELIDAWVTGRRPNFLGGPLKLVEFLMSAHITGLAVGMLIYTNDRIWPTVFATAVAIGSKAIFRVPVGGRSRHFLNPSNFGITIVFLAFPSVGAAPPYHFTENVGSVIDWVIPGLIVVSGSFINWRFTGRLPLIAGWLGGFALQGIIRSMICDTPMVASFIPMTGLAFILYTFYMVTDPATTPEGKLSQFVFGLGVAASYGLLMAAHIVFGLFFALTIVSSLRGIGIYIQALLAQKSQVDIPSQVSAADAAANQ